MDPTRTWLFIGVAAGGAAIGAAALAMPAGVREAAADAPAIGLLALMPAGALFVVRARPKQRSAWRGSTPRGGAALAWGVIACLLVEAMVASVTAAGPIAAVVAFGALSLLAAFSSPDRDRELAPGSQTADPQAMAPAAANGGLPRAEAA